MCLTTESWLWEKEDVVATNKSLALEDSSEGNMHRSIRKFLNMTAVNHNLSCGAIREEMDI